MINFDSLMPTGFSWSIQSIPGIGDIMSIKNNLNGKIVDAKFSESDLSLDQETFKDQIFSWIIASINEK